MNIVVPAKFKSLDPGSITVNIPNFVVLTGPNGSGKSNLLEALSSGAAQLVGSDAVPLGPIRYFPPGSLMAAAEGAQPAAQFKEPWAGWWSQVQQWKTNPEQMGLPGAIGPALEQSIENQILANNWLSRPAMDRLKRAVGKPLVEITYEDMREHGPMLGGVRDPFAASIAEIFLTYRIKLDYNQMGQWLIDTKAADEVAESTTHVRSDDEFVGAFGPPPWELLNQALRLVQLPYAFDLRLGVSKWPHGRRGLFETTA